MDAVLDNDIIEIGMKEKRLVMNILKFYNINPVSISKVRSVYKINTQDNIYCLKRMKHGKNKAKNGYILVDELHKKGFFNTPKYFKTQNKAYCVKSGKYMFYLTEWVSDGKECNIADFDLIKKSVRMLAEFHLKVQTINTAEMKLRINSKNLPKDLYGFLLDLDKFKNLLNSKRIKSTFDNMYEKYIQHYYNNGLVAFNLINGSKYYDLNRDAVYNKTICHDSFYYQNIIDKGENLYLIDLDSIVVDIQSIDLAKFIRRIMYRKEYNWNFEKARILIDEYSKIKEITQEEKKIMLSIMVFPHKFWKTGKRRYIKNKNWTEYKYIKRLEKLVEYVDMERQFMELYIKHYNIQ